MAQQWLVIFHWQGVEELGKPFQPDIHWVPVLFHPASCWSLGGESAVSRTALLDAVYF